MNVNATGSWKELLEEEFKQPYFKKLRQFVVNEYEKNTCYPPMNEVFNAFKYCELSNLRVVILGQDPYHGKGQANGLCFSVNNGVKHPPSLVNILKELSSDYNTMYPASGNLVQWAKQGVLLLNATLTVRESEAGSHQNKGWEEFTDNVIQLISDYKEGVVFLLWGGYAKKKAKIIDKNKHVVLTSGHPSPLSANRGYWFGNQHFSKTNTVLLENNKETINWNII
ncbi:uracil-DNA glycosylase [Pseudofulvibacter geojedonensis]|uniref:Uracil-DNA glycosylase n=1 Tax=Pseudofulvibacter geojedonensis TaxID=1123758 RepID=A0ABW3HYB3_9FLAO